jgi:hypothetical protein
LPLRVRGKQKETSHIFINATILNSNEKKSITFRKYVG